MGSCPDEQGLQEGQEDYVLIGVRLLFVCVLVWWQDYG